MRVCVYGAGAIGGHLAARLARGGAEVAVLARGPHLAAIQHDGLTVHTSEGQLHARVQASDDPRALGPQDAVLVTVKAPALPAVAAGIAPLLKPDTPVAFVMNGIPWFYFHGIGGALEGRRLPKIDPDDALWRAVGPERTIAGVVYAASAVIAPGVIELENPNSRVVLGEPDGSASQRVQAIAALINGGGMKAVVSTAIRDEIWNKLLGNLGNAPMAVLTQVSIRDLFQEPECVAAARRVMQEAQAVANALGAKPDADHDRRIAHGRSLDHKPSILQDLELGRPMEIDGIFDAPLELARMVGVATPTLDLVVAMAKVRARAAGLLPALTKEDVAMEMRAFGRSGLQVSILGFGCGAVGGLMVRGTAADQERAVARALEAGVNYFDTAAMYGNGESEKNLGRVLAKLKPNVVVGTKVRIPSAEFGRIGAAVAESLEASLKRMGREQVDIFHLHNAITRNGDGESLAAKTVLDEVVPAFEKLREQGKLRFPGITAVGDTPALHQVLDSRAFVSAQVSYNMLNPSAAEALPAGYPAQDYGRMFDHTQAAGVGVVGIRVLAGGALSGVAERHPIASPPPDPIGSANSYDADLQRARRLMPLVQQGHAGSLAEAAVRFAMTYKAMGTILVGMATPAEFEDALVAVNKGPLPQAALDSLVGLQRGFTGEAR